MGGGRGMVNEKQVKVQNMNRHIAWLSANEFAKQFQGRFATRVKRESLDDRRLRFASQRRDLPKEFSIVAVPHGSEYRARRAHNRCALQIEARRKHAQSLLGLLSETIPVFANRQAGWTSPAFR